MKNDSVKKYQWLREARQVWDQAADTFDQEPDHGLRDPQVLDAWEGLLKTWLPDPPKAVLDIGCGTGSLSVVMAGLGHKVTGADLSPAMLALARAKAAAQGVSIEFKVMDAAAPRFALQSFDALVCRHLLWALPEIPQVLARWVALLKPHGRLLLVEGFWSTGSGLHASELVTQLPASVTVVTVQNLSDQPEYWGKPVADERYAIIAQREDPL